ncbi:SpaA isopeptide-forming pilin-related protein [Paenibacillus sp. GCM10027626]|uniref:SpaA isopeptide-forming pilin-related protein n=1 Tax=Paenibacillus sp. GCM10027626 TaxID=3273411 RepID=UPI0036441244
MLLWGLFGSLILAPSSAIATGDPGFNYTVTSNVYELNRGEYIALKVEYEAKQVGAINEGDQLTFTLPSILKDVTPKYPPEHIRDCSITENEETSQTEVTCTFGANMQSGLKGYMLLEATLSWKAEPGTLPIVVTIKNMVTTLDVTIVDPGNGGPKENLIEKWNGNLGFDENHNGVVTDPGKPIEYYIRVNGALKDLKNVKVVDYIPPGLELVEDSMKFYVDSPYEEENLLKKPPHWSVNNNEIHFDFGDIERAYFIRYEMKIVDLKPEYNNSAKITADGEKEYTAEIVKLGKTAGAINVLKKADKELLSSDQGSDQIVNYTIQFYSFGEFKQNSIVVTDLIDSRVDLIEDSIVVTDQFSYTYDPVEHKLTVTNDNRSIKAGEQPKIEYKVDFSRLEPGAKVSNIANVGNVPTNEVIVEKKGKDPEIPNPKPDPDPEGKIEIVKVDADDQNRKLEGAAFTLSRKNTEGELVVIASKTTDADGTAVFEGLKYDDYVIQETAAPKGYQLDGTKHSVSLQSPKVSLTFTNQKESTPNPKPDPDPDPDPETPYPWNPYPGTESPKPDPNHPIDPVEPVTPQNPNVPVEPTDEGELVTIVDEEVPRGQADGAEKPDLTDELLEEPAIIEETVSVETEAVPLAGLGDKVAAVDKLPQTGETSPTPYYWSGLGLSALGLLLLRGRKLKKNSQQ